MRALAVEEDSSLKEKASLGIGGIFSLVMLYLLFVLVAVKGATDLDKIVTPLQLVLTLLLFVSLAITNQEKRILVFFLFLPLAGFAIPPRSLRISLLFVASTVMMIIVLRKDHSLGFSELLKSSVGPLMKWYAAWFGVWSLISYFGVDMLSSLYSIFLFFFLPLIAVVLFQAREQGIGPDELWIGIKAALWICVIFVGFQLIFGLDYSLSQFQNQNFFQENTGIRYPGPFTDSIAFSQFLSVLLLFVLMFRPRRFDIIGIFVGVLGFIVLLLNGSRTAPIGAVLGMLFVSFMTPGNRTKIVIRVVVILAIVLFVSLFIDLEKIALVKRLLLIQFAAEKRISIWLKSITIFFAYPWTGIGFDNFSKVVLKFNPEGFWKTSEGAVPYISPESGYLKFLTETGIVGFFVFSAFIVRTIIEYVKALRNRTLDHQSSSFIAASFASYICILISQITVYTLIDPRILFLLGFLTAIPFLYGRHKVTEAVLKQ